MMRERLQSDAKGCARVEMYLMIRYIDLTGGIGKKSMYTAVLHHSQTPVGAWRPPEKRCIAKVLRAAAIGKGRISENVTRLTISEA